MPMRFSTRGRYGLRVMIELAGHFGNGPVSAETLARRQGISEKYIHRLVGPLQAVGLIRAVRGAKGGYELARPPAEITAFDVVTTMEGRTEPVPCLDGKARCGRATRCQTRDLWRAVAVDRVLAGHSLAELGARAPAGRDPSPTMGDGAPLPPRTAARNVGFARRNGADRT